MFFFWAFFNCKTVIFYEKQELDSLSIDLYKTNSNSKILMIHLDPLTFDKKVFLSHWNPYWLRKGMEMLYVNLPTKKLLEPKEVQIIIKKIKENYLIQDKKVILVGISLGGIPILDLLNSSEPLESKTVDKILLIGTGFDYSYSGNFFKENPEVLNKKIKEIHSKTLLKYKEYLLNQYDPYIVNEFFLPQISLEKKEIKYITKRNLPLLVVAGKIDSFSPEDTLYNLIKYYSKDTNPSCKIVTKLNPCYYIEVSRANFFDRDYNHFDLFLYKNVENDLYGEILDWIYL